MDASPLTQQSRPESFQPKIVHLYESLFKEEEEIAKPEGFWGEFFLHKPDPASLRDILRTLSPDDLLHFQVWPAPRRQSTPSFIHIHIHSLGAQLLTLGSQAHPQQFVLRAISRIKAAVPPSDENALEVRSVASNAHHPPHHAVCNLEAHIPDRP
jgi:hypothetical protein